jgi:hypothetical protein
MNIKLHRAVIAGVVLYLCSAAVPALEAAIESTDLQ